MTFAFVFTNNPFRLETTEHFTDEELQLKELLPGVDFFKDCDRVTISEEGTWRRLVSDCRRCDSMAFLERLSGYFVFNRMRVDRATLLTIFLQLYEWGYAAHDSVNIFIMSVTDVPFGMYSWFLKMCTEHLVHIEFITEKYAFEPTDRSQPTPHLFNKQLELDHERLLEGFEATDNTTLNPTK